MLNLLNTKKHINKPFIHRRYLSGCAIIAGKEILCWARNFFLTVRSGLIWFCWARKKLSKLEMCIVKLQQILQQQWKT